MEMSFGKFKGMEIEDFTYEHLPYLIWLLDNIRIKSAKLKQLLEWKVLDMEAELDILATYYNVEDFYE